MAGTGSSMWGFDADPDDLQNDYRPAGSTYPSSRYVPPARNNQQTSDLLARARAAGAAAASGVGSYNQQLPADSPGASMWGQFDNAVDAQHGIAPPGAYGSIQQIPGPAPAGAYGSIQQISGPAPPGAYGSIQQTPGPAPPGAYGSRQQYPALDVYRAGTTTPGGASTTAPGIDRTAGAGGYSRMNAMGNLSGRPAYGTGSPSARMVGVNHPPPRAVEPVVIRDQVDIVFLMDVTGSMQKYIDQVRDALSDIIEGVRRDYASFDPRIAFVGYRDFSDAERFVVKDFTTNVDEMKAFIGEIKAKGGGDFPEDVKGGLNETILLGWRSKSKVLLHIADAPPHGPEYTGGRFKDNFPDGGPNRPNDLSMPDVLLRLHEMRIVYNFMRLNDTCDHMIPAFNAIFRSFHRGKDIKVSDLGGLDSSAFLGNIVASIASSIARYT